MLTPERHQRILDLLKEKEVIRIQEITEATGASESTIRRDLSELEEQKLLQRVHGGASSLPRKMEESTFLERAMRNEKEKTAIAKYAAGLVNEHDSVYLDAGTTTYRMIPYLPQDNLVVVTNGVNIALELLKRNIKTILLGGELKARTWAVVGRDAVTTIGQYRFDKCFLGINGIDAEHGLTTPDPDEAHVKQLALRYSDEKYVLADSSKFSRITFAKVAELDGLHVITDEGLDDVQREAYQKKTKLKVVTV